MSEQFLAGSGELPPLGTLVDVAVVEGSWKNNVTTCLHADSMAESLKVEHIWRDSWRESRNAPDPALDLLVVSSVAIVVACVYAWSMNTSNNTSCCHLMLVASEQGTPVDTLQGWGSSLIQWLHPCPIIEQVGVCPSPISKHRDTPSFVWDLWTGPSWHTQ